MNAQCCLRKMFHRIIAKCLKWRTAFSVLCDRRIFIKLERKFCRMDIRSIVLYGSDYRAIKKHVQKISRMRMLR